MPHTITELLSRATSDGKVFSTQGPLARGALRALVGRTLATVNALGLGRNDRVAVALANGPERASCFIACARGVASALLNSAHRVDELKLCLLDLGAKALIAEQGSNAQANEVVGKLGVRLIELVVAEGAAADYFSPVPRDGAAHIASCHGGLRQVGRRVDADERQRNHVASKDRAAVARQPVRVGHPHCAHAGFHSAG